MKISKRRPAPALAPARRQKRAQPAVPKSTAQALDVLNPPLPPTRAEAHTPLASRGLGFEPHEVAAYEAANRALVGKYPTLDVVLKDPDRFVADMSARFDAQKKLTPTNPYAFDYSDYGLPVMKGISAAVEKEIAEVEKGTDHPAERAKGVAYLKELKADIDGHLSTGEISYRRTQELSYFVSEALGHFDHRRETAMQRAFLVIDRYLDGYTAKSLDQQIDNYHRNAFSVFDTRAAKSSGLDEFHDTFDKAFFSTDKLELISLPTMEPLNDDIFFRLNAYNLFPVGVAADPIAADGFVRPGGDFWVHDLRHSSDMFARRKVYESEHHMSEPQIRKLQKRIDVWRTELLGAIEKLPDKNLRGAVVFQAFNYHHDRGRPMVPSSFLPEKVDYTPKLLAMMQNVAGQDKGFKGQRYVQESYQWLRQFWLPKLDEERAILGAVELGPRD
jgi:hypothetical protein